MTAGPIQRQQSGAVARFAGPLRDQFLGKLVAHHRPHYSRDEQRSRAEVELNELEVVLGGLKGRLKIIQRNRTCFLEFLLEILQPVGTRINRIEIVS